MTEVVVERCARCKESVPGWFLEPVVAFGAFSPPARPAFDEVPGLGWDGEAHGCEPGQVRHLEVAPLPPPPASPYGGNPAYACYHCTNGWPYPNFSELEEDYVERLKKWRQRDMEGGSAADPVVYDGPCSYREPWPLPEPRGGVGEEEK